MQHRPCDRGEERALLEALVDLAAVLEVEVAEDDAAEQEECQRGGERDLADLPEKRMVAVAELYFDWHGEGWCAGPEDLIVWTQREAIGGAF